MIPTCFITLQAIVVEYIDVVLPESMFDQHVLHARCRIITVRIEDLAIHVTRNDDSLQEYKGIGDLNVPSFVLVMVKPSPTHKLRGQDLPVCLLLESLAQ